MKRINHAVSQSIDPFTDKVAE